MSGGWALSPDAAPRKDRLPADWAHLRSMIEARAGGRCEARMRSGKRCHDKGTDCDHIVRGDDHSPGNLQWLCSWHHRQKTAAEANAAKGPAMTAKHPREKHPGGLSFY